jgi:hypothetical protein
MHLAAQSGDLPTTFSQTGRIHWKIRLAIPARKNPIKSAIE